MNPRRLATLIAALALSLGPLGCGSDRSSSESRGSPSSAGSNAGNSEIRPSNFVTTVDNPWFPLRPGTTLRYRGFKDGKPTVEAFSVTNMTQSILGVQATVVHDTLYDTTGKPVEDTIDWYAQDKRGNVWYLGEATKELDAKGHVTSRSGSWRAGVNGATAGIFMPANPKAGQSFRQEHYKGEAEDQFRILSVDTPVKVPALSSQHGMRTEETTPLEPGTVDNKYYVRGVGTVREQAVKGPKEYNILTAVTR